MGDSYAKDEFKRHRDAQTTNQQWAVFEDEWRKYFAMLSGEADISASGEIPPDVLTSLNSEQKVRLNILELEARKALDNLIKDT